VALIDVSAVITFPAKGSFVFESFSLAVVVEKLLIAFLVSCFYLGNAAELCGQLRKSFVFSLFSHSLIHICPLIVFAGSSICKIFIYTSDAVELFEPHFGMLFFLICCLLKDIRHLNKSGFSCSRRIVSILVAGL